MPAQAPLSARQVSATVGMTMAVQAFTAFALSVAGVLAPVVAPELGVPAVHVGLLVALQFLAGIFSGLLCAALIVRYGPIGTLRMAVVLAIAGLAAAAGGNVVLLVAFAVLCGCAHGLVNPPTSQVLMEAAPPRMRSLIFSIKQTGVPLGMAVAGALLPPMLLFMSWQQALLGIAGAAFVFLVLLLPFYALFDRRRDPAAKIGLANLSEPLAASLASPQLREFILSAGVYAFVQPCMTTYLVIYLNLELGYSLVAAGLVFALATLAGVFGRVAWGALADWSGSPRRVLAGLGVIMGASGAAASAFSPAWPAAAVIAVCALWGASAVGWNGVYLAEVARLAPEGQVSLATGGSQVYLFTGAVIAPPLFGLLASAAGFSTAYLLLAVLPVVAGAALLRPRHAVEAPRAG
jgi:MFS family permease